MISQTTDKKKPRSLRMTGAVAGKPLRILTGEAMQKNCATGIIEQAPTETAQDVMTPNPETPAAVATAPALQAPMNKCPNCTTGFFMVHQDCRDPKTGQRYSQNVQQPCETCNGTREVTDEVLARHSEMMEAREARRNPYRSQEAEAKRLGLTRRELGDILFGRADEELWGRYRTARKAAEALDVEPLPGDGEPIP